MQGWNVFRVFNVWWSVWAKVEIWKLTVLKRTYAVSIPRKVGWIKKKGWLRVCIWERKGRGWEDWKWDGRKKSVKEYVVESHTNFTWATQLDGERQHNEYRQINSTHTVNAFSRNLISFHFDHFIVRSKKNLCIS